MYILHPWFRYWHKWVVSTPFGEKGADWAGGVHMGSDMVASDGRTYGSVVLCPLDGVVDVVSWRKDRGWYVCVADTAQGVEFFVCHLMSEPCLESGDTVEVGEIIGIVGNTGTRKTGLPMNPHAHIEVRKIDGDLAILERIDPFGEEVHITI